MFARTHRLTLRPAWPEDGAAVVAAIRDRRVAEGLAGASPAFADAGGWIVGPRGAHEPRFLIEAHGGRGPSLVGGIAIADGRDGPELGCWLIPSARGRGYAAEAGRSVVEMARCALPITRLIARHRVGDAAAGRWLRGLGFRPAGDPVRESATLIGGGLVVHDLDVEGCRSILPIAA